MNKRTNVNKILSIIIDGSINDRKKSLEKLEISERTLERYIEEFEYQQMIYKRRSGKYIIIIPSEALRKRFRRGYYVE